MALEFVFNPSTTDILMVVVVFLLFVMAINKVMNVLKDVVMVSVAFVIIPIIGNRVFGLPITTDVNSLINYIIIGIAMYFVYTGGKKILNVGGKVIRVGSKIIPKRSKRSKEKNEPRVQERPEVRYEYPKFGNKKVKNETFKDYVVIEDEPNKDVANLRKKTKAPDLPQKKRIEPLHEMNSERKGVKKR